MENSKTRHLNSNKSASYISIKNHRSAHSPSTKHAKHTRPQSNLFPFHPSNRERSSIRMNLINSNSPDSDNSACSKQELKTELHSRPLHANKKRKQCDILETWMDFLPSLLARYEHESAPWQFKNREYSKFPTVMLHEEILDFVKFIEPTQEEHLQRKSVLAAIKNVLERKIKGSCVVSFGSFETLFYLPQSDIDLTLAFEDNFAPKDITSTFNFILWNLNSSQEFHKTEPVRFAKVPIIKTVHKRYGISVDISVNQTVGLRTANKVKDFLIHHPALRPLIFVLKMFFYCRELNEVFTGGISSYTLITMVYTFLELHPLLSSGEIKEEENLGILLIEWLELYSRCFHPDLSVVTKDGFMNKNAKMVQAQGLNANFLSVRDPINADNDLSRGAKSTREILRAIEWGYDILTHAILVSQSNSHVRIPTYLGLILYVDESLIRKRRCLIMQSKETEKCRNDLNLPNFSSNRKSKKDVLLCYP